MLHDDPLIGRDERIEWVDRDQALHGRGHGRERIDDGREPEPELQANGDHLRDITKENVDDPQEDPEGEGKDLLNDQEKHHSQQDPARPATADEQEGQE